jgi:DMSO/TMAO reductase YedYZ molybdopterin-dependent catalytic subunit
MSGSRWNRLGRGLLAGVLASLSLIAASLALRVLAGIPLVAELAADRIIPTLSVRQFGQLARLMGGLEVAKELTLLGGFGLELLVGAAAGAVFFSFMAPGDRAKPRRGPHLVAVVLGLAWLATVAGLWPVLDSSYIGLPPDPATAAAAAGLAIIYGVYGVALAVAVRSLAPIPRHRPEEDARSGSPEDQAQQGVGRRAVLVAGVAAILGAATGGFVRWLHTRATVGPNGYDGLRTVGPRIDPVTPNDRFYVVTKNLVDPRVRSNLWRLEVTGAVERPHTFTLDEITAMPAMEQVQTLECISNGVGGGLMSNAVWTGVPLPDILIPARPLPGALQVVAHAADGYVHVIPLDKALEATTFLAYRMNGVPLPDRHGYPMRLLVPGTFGEVSVKWVDRIDLVDRPEQGYYEQQGWRPFHVPTTSRFDDPTSGTSIRRSQGGVALAGVAFAGDRGISKVEFSSDGGRSWVPAQIDYHPSPLTWALWSARWHPAAPGTYRLAVRATDGAGDVQTAERRGTAPSGATGYHQIEVRIIA